VCRWERPGWHAPGGASVAIHGSSARDEHSVCCPWVATAKGPRDDGDFWKRVKLCRRFRRARTEILMVR
jgi:hypothetical protein